MRSICTAVVATLALVATSFAAAETITVCSSGCQYNSINAAIAVAQTGDIIQLSDETYTEGAVINTFGKAITLRGAVDKSGTAATILDGGGSHRVVYCHSSEGAATVFENLVIQNGYSSTDGGGMWNVSSSPTLTNCTFTNNSADYGGGMFNDASNPTLTGCTFTENSAAHSGGGMFNANYSSPTLTDLSLIHI